MQLRLTSAAEREAEKAQQFPAFSGINLVHIRNEVAEALTNFGRFGLLEEYTKHDITHIDSMLAMYDWMVPDNTRGLMTPADWLLITLSTYLHDFGLLVTRDEYDQRETLPAFESYKRRVLDNEDPGVRDYRSQVELMDSEAAERFMYQEFVRYFHAHRIRAWLQESNQNTWGFDPRVADALRSLLAGVDESFREDVGIVCESHHLDDLSDLNKYPLDKPYGSTREQEANVQYAALLLRTSDLLHITSNRVPAISALIVNPRNPKSQIEWSKQRAVRRVRPLQPLPAEDGVLHQPETVEVHALFREAEGYFGLTNYLQYAARQLTDTFSISKANQVTGASQYEFPWRRIDISHIEARGFVAQPFKFTIDQGKILDLLTGHTLYNDTSVVVRELVQNSLDAVRLQRVITDDKYEPRIQITWDSEKRELSVLDNGTGMTQAVIERNFLGVGSSRYQEPHFKKQYPEFTSISRFGIGVLSTFMVADDVSVVTSHPDEPQARKLSLRDVHGQYLVRLVDKTSADVPSELRDHGTVVRIKLRPSATLQSILQILRYWIIVPGCEVSLKVDGEAAVNVGHETVDTALYEALVESKLVQGELEAMRTPYGDPVEIRHRSNGQFDMAYAVAWSRWLQEWRFLALNRVREDERTPLSAGSGIAVSGVRVTTDQPGYRAGGVASFVNVSGRFAPRTNVARSALERTDEYDRLLDEIYASLFEHIAHEMNEFENSRHSSLTRAAQEGMFLAEELVEGVIESRETFDGHVLASRVIVIEVEGVRERVSVRDLAVRPQLASIDSTMISSLESVLQSVRGVSSASASVRNMLNATGSSEQMLPEVPIVCGVTGGSGVASLFMREWEVVKFATDADARQLTATWEPATDPRRWRRPQRNPPAGLNFANLRLEVARRSMSPLARGGRVIFCTDPSNVTAEGFSHGLIQHFGNLFVLPHHPVVTELVFLDELVGIDTRIWCAAQLLSLLLPDPESAISVNDMLRMEYGLTPHRSKLSSIYESAQMLGLTEVITEDSLNAVIADPQMDVLDVKLWDARRH